MKTLLTIITEISLIICGALVALALIGGGYAALKHVDSTIYNSTPSL